MKNSAFIRLVGEQGYTDLYTIYGISFLKGSWLELLKKSQSKGYVENDSRLEHGVKVVAKPEYAKYAKKTLSLTILLEAANASDFSRNLEEFTDKVSRGMFELKVPTIDRVFRLVYTDISIKQQYRNFKATFTLELQEPNCNDRTRADGTSIV